MDVPSAKALSQPRDVALAHRRAALCGALASTPARRFVDTAANRPARRLANQLASSVTRSVCYEEAQLEG
jgi:hypothetical protein